ncbi:hypothetical protein [Bacillus sp. B-jedd]|uniref:hypothetical protein n=1 Tax=Bacillus sp. B-jedd TaxID=1476857 RepID=UPI0005155B7E|nr:hypothetical protein [Bacillus sp. B-jedd]CEG26448.1 hypothetical protein BN1002_01295 [Bacillus sp. B-jedd]
MSTVKCTILTDAGPIRFAEEELLRYGQNAGRSFVLGTYDDFLKKGLLEVTETAMDSSLDAFQVLDRENEVCIIGSNPRSVLFGVYDVCKKLFGYKWVSFFPEENLFVSEVNIGSSGIQSGKMKRRGLVVENYDNPEFLLKLIDWAAKHYINEFFFTFMLWDKVEHIIGKEIEKRGLDITLGGHSMHYLLREESGSGQKQIDFSKGGWKDSVIEKIEDYCRESSSINRISLWPADIGIKDDHRFLAHYIEFTEQLKKQLPALHVEHIAYNAGLSWQMLELPDGTDSSKTVDTLFAYWGRNYRESFSKEKRACEALRKWRQSTGARNRELTVFEYYSDHFMLGDLFPPLFHRIREDIELYAEMGIDQIVNLIVPYIPKENPTKEELQYPWEDVQLMNGYFFARLTWGDPFEEIEQDFYSIFGRKQKEARQVLQEMEAALSEVSKWNARLFPSRLIDPEKVDAFVDADLIVKDIIRWQKRLEPFKDKPVGVMSDQDSLVSFYVHFAKKKLEEYLLKWEEKSGSRKMDS